MTLSALSVQSSAIPADSFHYGIRELAMSANLTGQAAPRRISTLAHTFVRLQ